MKHKIAGIAICIFLITNVSIVLGISEEKLNINEEKKYYIFVNSLTEKEIKGTLIYTNDNLAPNPSFELGCCVFPSGWTYSIDDKSKFHWDMLFSHTGGKSIGTLNLTENTRSSCWITAEFIPVDFVNNTYEFSGWYTFIGTPTERQYAAFILRMYDEKFNNLGDIGSHYNFSSEWKYVSENTSDYCGIIINETKYVKLGLYQYYTQNEPDSLIEVRFDDIYFGFGNDPPNKPTITGETNGAIETSYNYTVQTNDPDKNDVKYYIDWGDNTHTITDLYKPGEYIIISHKWETKGSYSIKVKASDEHYAESDWETLSVTIPCSYNTQIPQFLDFFFQRFHNAFPLLRQIFGY